MTPDQRAVLYDFLVADWPIFVAWTARERGWKTAQCEEFLASLIEVDGLPVPPLAPAWAG